MGTGGELNQQQQPSEQSPEQAMEQVIEALRSAKSEDDLLAHLDRIDEEVIKRLETENTVATETSNEVGLEPPKSADGVDESAPSDVEDVALEEADEILKILESETPAETASPQSETPQNVEAPPQHGVEAILQTIDNDPVLRQLIAMNEEERIAWATKNGAMGIAKLLQLQKLETALMIERAKLEATKPSLDAMLESWAKKNAELLQDPTLKEIAVGLEMKFLAERGKMSYEQLSVIEMREMLDYIESTLRSIKQTMSGGASDGVQGQEQGQREGQRQGEVSGRAGLGIADIGGGAPPNQSEVEVLERIASDPLKLEEAVAKLPPEKLDNLLAELL